MRILDGLSDALGEVVHNLLSARDSLNFKLRRIVLLRDAFLSQLIRDIIQHVVKLGKYDRNRLEGVSEEFLKVLKLLELLKSTLSQVDQNSGQQGGHIVIDVALYTAGLKPVLNAWHIHYGQIVTEDFVSTSILHAYLDLNQRVIIFIFLDNFGFLLSRSPTCRRRFPVCLNDVGDLLDSAHLLPVVYSRLHRVRIGQQAPLEALEGHLLLRLDHEAPDARGLPVVRHVEKILHLRDLVQEGALAHIRVAIL